MPTRPKSVSSTGNSKQKPKAKISVITKERYSPTRACSSIGSVPFASRRFEAEEELNGVGQDEVIDEGAAHDEHHRCREQERHEGGTLVPIKTGRDEHPELKRHEGKREAERTEHADLHIGEERLVQRREDHRCVGPLRQRIGQGLR